MTQQEFNKKYVKYIEPGFYALAFNIPEVTNYLDNCFDKFINQYDFKIMQIKIKWDYCRIYCDGIPKEVIEEMENNINEINKRTDFGTKI